MQNSELQKKKSIIVNFPTSTGNITNYCVGLKSDSEIGQLVEIGDLHKLQCGQNDGSLRVVQYRETLILNQFVACVN